MMRVKEIMNRRPVLLSPDMTLRKAAEMLIENKISGAPVVDSQGKLIGFLMLGDIIHFIKNRLMSVGIIIPPTPFDFIDFYQYELPVETKDSIRREISETKVSEVMCRRVHTVNPDEDLWSVIYILAKKDVSHVPVVDENQRVIGIITRSDVIKALSQLEEITD